MIGVDEAIRLLLNEVSPTSAEVVDLLDAVGRVLARDVYAREDFPSFNRSALDGYAVVSDDTMGASPSSPKRLKVIGEVAAGEQFQTVVAPGSAVRISTGAPVPPGADAVVRFEDTREASDEVEVYAAVERNSNVSRVGEDIRKGMLLLKNGTFLRSPEIGVLAVLGEASVLVHRRPVVAILGTGSELVDIREEVAPGKVRDSNCYSLAAGVVMCGGIPRLLGTVRDRVSEIEQKLSTVGEVDMLLTTGGASVGRHDLIREVLDGLGARLLFWRVAMKPGTPVVAAVLNRTLFFGLSGNPAAAITSFDILVRPGLLKMAGRRDWRYPEITAVLEGGYARGGKLRRYLRARIHLEGDSPKARILAGQRSGVLSTMTLANGYVIVPESRRTLEPGEKVKALLLEPVAAGNEVETGLGR